MMKELTKKVDEVYFHCVDKQITNLSTLEKLSSTGKQLHLLLQQLESFPKKLLKKLRCGKAIERKCRFVLHNIRL